MAEAIPVHDLFINNYVYFSANTFDHLLRGVKITECMVRRCEHNIGLLLTFVNSNFTKVFF